MGNGWQWRGTWVGMVPICSSSVQTCVGLRDVRPPPFGSLGLVALRSAPPGRLTPRTLPVPAVHETPYLIGRDDGHGGNSHWHGYGDDDGEGGGAATGVK